MAASAASSAPLYRPHPQPEIVSKSYEGCRQVARLLTWLRILEVGAAHTHMRCCARRRILFSYAEGGAHLASALSPSAAASVTASVASAVSMASSASSKVPSVAAAAPSASASTSASAASAVLTDASASSSAPLVAPASPCAAASATSSVASAVSMASSALSKVPSVAAASPSAFASRRASPASAALTDTSASCRVPLKRPSPQTENSQRLRFQAYSVRSTRLAELRGMVVVTPREARGKSERGRVPPGLSRAPLTSSQGHAIAETAQG
eukprot:1181335-Prorocentrum_minimum.AAC.5